MYNTTATEIMEALDSLNSRMTTRLVHIQTLDFKDIAYEIEDGLGGFFEVYREASAPVRGLFDLDNFFENLLQTDSTGSVQRFQGISVDISEMKRVLDKLRERFLQLRTLISTLRRFQIGAVILSWLRLSYANVKFVYGKKKRKIKSRSPFKVSYLGIRRFAKKGIFSLGYILFIIAALVLAVEFYNFNRAILASSGGTITYSAGVTSNVTIDSKELPGLWTKLLQITEPFGVSGNMTFNNCHTDPGPFLWTDETLMWVNFGMMIFLLGVYSLLPTIALWIKPLKRAIFQFNQVFWVRDKNTWLANGYVNSCCKPDTELDTEMMDHIATTCFKQMRKGSRHNNPAREVAYLYDIRDKLAEMCQRRRDELQGEINTVEMT